MWSRSIEASQIAIAGISMETLEENAEAAFSSRPSLASIYLKYSALKYLGENRKDIESDNFSSSSERRIVVTFPAEIIEGFKDENALRRGAGRPHFTSPSSPTAEDPPPSPTALSAVKDSLHLLSASQGVVYNMVAPSSLPLTGGSWVLIVSSAAVLLFAAGAVMLKRRKKA